ncbi:MAG TPA: hypothetical protein VD866_30125 [Urbifossiella sp.]|nr:hypothetical protein [Urbifossiella sp.]
MATVDPQLVMALYRRTDMPLMVCKAALVEAGGDMDGAIEVLRRRCNPFGGCVGASPGFWEQFRSNPPLTARDAEPIEREVLGNSPSGAESWAVWRIDDNGNTFLVRGGLARDEADRVAAEFTARGHKQMYWVEREAAEPAAAPDRPPPGGS